MTTSYRSLLDSVEFPVDTTPVPARVREQVHAAIAERQLARIEESLDLVRDHPSSVLNVFEYGLGHPGGVSAEQIIEGVGVSPRTLKRAHKVLQERALASFETRYYRGGRTVLWHYATGLSEKAFGDLGSVPRGDLDSVPCAHGNTPLVAPSQDPSITPVTSENGLNSGQAAAARLGSTSLYMESREVLAGVVRGETPSVTLSSSRASRRRGDLADPAWTDSTLSAAPVLARYREILSARKAWVRGEDADRIHDQLVILAEDHGNATALEFLDHVAQTCRMPYLADVTRTFQDRWLGYDRHKVDSEPQTPAETPEARRDRYRANNDRLRARALAGRSAA